MANRIELDNNKIRQLFRDGYSKAEMARKLFVSETTIDRRLKELGLTHGRVVYDKEMFLRMEKLEIKHEDIAYIFGASPRDLSRWKSRVGLSKQYNKRGDNNGKENS